MKSITIRGLEGSLGEKIERLAKKKGWSLNKTIIGLLKTALGMDNLKQTDHLEDFLEFLGVWSQEDVRSFYSAITELEEVHPEDWR